MADFNLAIKIILQHEGGYSHVSGDEGGETNFGISSRSYPDEDIKGMTSERASEIYLHDFWRPLLLDDINSQGVADTVFDQAVNAGKTRAVSMLQNVLNAMGSNLVQDGAMGQKTVEAANSMDAETLFLNYQQKRIDYYKFIATKPSNSKFLQGWINRVNDIVFT